jgi:hypothetical protein
MECHHTQINLLTDSFMRQIGLSFGEFDLEADDPSFWLMIFSTLSTAIVMMNLLIAVITQKYDEAVKESGGSRDYIPVCDLVI